MKTIHQGPTLLVNLLTLSIGWQEYVISRFLFNVSGQSIIRKTTFDQNGEISYSRQKDQYLEMPGWDHITRELVINKLKTKVMIIDRCNNSKREIWLTNYVDAANQFIYLCLLITYTESSTKKWLNQRKYGKVMTKTNKQRWGCWQHLNFVFVGSLENFMRREEPIE